MEEMRSRLSEFLSTVFVFTVKHSLALKEQLTQKMKHSAHYLLALIIHRLMKRWVKKPRLELHHVKNELHSEVSRLQMCRNEEHWSQK